MILTDNVSSQLLKRHVTAALMAVVLLAAAAPAFAQKYQFLGRVKCVNCHDHDDQKLWSEKKDGPPPNNHLNALKQMENVQRSDAFARAVGIPRVNGRYDGAYDADSICVRCHATVVRGDVSGGVTCETCHGAGSGYLDPHQKKDSYKQSVALGMNDVVMKPEAWATMCVKCHVMDDQRLVDARHPSGQEIPNDKGEVFDLGKKFLTVATGHWKSQNYEKYDKAKMSALGKTEEQKIIVSRKPVVRPPVTTAPQPPPQPVKPTTQLVDGSTPAPPEPAPQTPSGDVQAPQPADTQPPPAGVQPEPTPDRGPVVPQPAPLQPGRPTQPVMTGLPPVAAVMQPPPETVGDTMFGISSLAKLLPLSPAAAVAAIQGQAIALIDSLLRRGGVAPLRVAPPEKKPPYGGVDADLLLLQDEVLALAIDALRTAPPPADANAPAKQ